MDAIGIAETVQGQDWLEPVGDVLQSGVAGAFSAMGPAGKTVEKALHGTWLGHPLHPALTDVPIGAWTSAVVLDAIEMSSGRSELAPCSDAAVLIGLAGAVGAAVTGLADWHVLKKDDQAPRRVGLAHGLLNVGAVLLYGTSYLLRRRNQRTAGQALGFLGYAVMNAAAYLGGHMVYELKVGVDHAPHKALPDQFVPVLPDSELPENELKRVDVAGTSVLLVRRDGRIDALAETCSHLGGPLSEGTLENGAVRCPWHGSEFDLASGCVVEGPSAFPQPHYETRVSDGRIEVRAIE